MKLMVAYDGSPGAESALDEVIRRPWPEGSQVRLVSVLDLPLMAVPSIDADAYLVLAEKVREVVSKDTTARLRKALQKFARRKDLETSFEIRDPGVKQALLDAAAAWKPDLLFVGSTGHTLLGRALIGSVAHAMVAHAPCSVEVVRPAAPPKRKR